MLDNSLYRLYNTIMYRQFRKKAADAFSAPLPMTFGGIYEIL